MARVPEPAQGPTIVAPASNVSPLHDTRTADVGGVLVGESLMAKGRDLKGLGRQFSRQDLAEKELDHRATVASAKLSASQFIFDNIEHYTNALELQGLKAKGSTKNTRELLETAAEKAAGDGVHYDEFMSVVVPWMARATQAMSRSEASQVASAEIQASKSLIETWQDEAEMHHNNEVEVDLILFLIRDAHAELSEKNIQGKSAPELKRDLAKDISTTRRRVIMANSITDPEHAAKMLEKYKDELTSDDARDARVAIEAALQGMYVTVLVDELVGKVTSGDMTISQAEAKIKKEIPDPKDPARKATRDALRVRITGLNQAAKEAEIARDRLLGVNAVGVMSDGGPEAAADALKLCSQIKNADARRVCENRIYDVALRRYPETKIGDRHELEVMSRDQATVEKFMNAPLHRYQLSPNDEERFSKRQESMKKGFPPPDGYSEMMRSVALQRGWIDENGKAESVDGEKKNLRFQTVVLNAMDREELAPVAGGGPRRITIPELNAIIASAALVVEPGGWFRGDEKVAYESQLASETSILLLPPNRPVTRESIDEVVDISISGGLVSETERHKFREHVSFYLRGAAQEGLAGDRIATSMHRVWQAWLVVKESDEKGEEKKARDSIRYGIGF